MIPRMIVSDLDGTLLTPDHRIPDSFWPLLDELDARGVVFVPASGRQLSTLKEQFGGRVHTFIAENGTMVEHRGQVLSTTTMDPQVASDAVALMATHPQVGAAVLCRTDGAFYTSTDEVFLKETAHYYARLTQVPDLAPLIDDQVIKVAIYTFAHAETTAAALLRPVGGLMSVSGPHWIDIYNPAANKGLAFTQLAHHLGVDLADTVAFGDYLNDMELLKVAGRSFAMGNAHPDIVAAATDIAPHHDQEGVVTTIRQLLSL